MKILCVFGKYQYGDSKRGISTEYFSFFEALKKLNHELYHFESWDKTRYSNFVELNEALVNEVHHIQPDVIITAPILYEIWIDTWKYIKDTSKAYTICWCSDDNWKFKEHSKFYAPYFDYMVTTYESCLQKYKEINTQAILSGWACPDQWLCYPKKATECKYQVSFVGTSHGNRIELVNRLSKMGITVACFGKGWPSGPIPAEMIPKIFRDSVISLNFANSCGDNQIKARTFEVPGSGGFLITENALGLENVFKADQEIVVYETLKECADKIKFYLENPDLRDQIAEKGFQKTVQNYTYSKRFEKILGYILHQKNVKPLITSNFEAIQNQHKNTWFILICRKILLIIGRTMFGKERGRRFARKLAYEISWRLLGAKTYTAQSIVGRMFYAE